MGHFRLKAKCNLGDLPIGSIISESDFASLTPDGQLVQLEYVEETQEVRHYDVKPGVWAIQKTATGCILEPTSFVNDAILESFVHTKMITDKIDCFFSRLHVYRQYGFEVPKRGMLLYGVAGTGKTTAAIKAAMKYINSDTKDTAVVVWGTDKIEAGDVKDFVKGFNYIGVKKLILIMEDIGGVEIDQHRMQSTASLLSLLDNQEKTFTIPVFILATTNHPENFLGNLTNRPGRFDDKIEVGYPSADARVELLKFFMKGEIEDEFLEKFRHKKFASFSPAHIKEIVIRSAIYDVSIGDAMDSISKEIEHYNNMFQQKYKMGLGYDD